MYHAIECYLKTLFQQVTAFEHFYKIWMKKRNQFVSEYLLSNLRR